MGKTTITEFQRRQIRFGYLFFSMRRTLCFTIAMDGEDIWAIEYRGDPAGQPSWHGDMFCATWWAVNHPAKVTTPQTEELHKVLAATVSQRFVRMHGQAWPQNTTGAVAERSPEMLHP